MTAPRITPLKSRVGATPPRTGFPAESRVAIDAHQDGTLDTHRAIDVPEEAPPVSAIDLALGAATGGAGPPLAASTTTSRGVAQSAERTTLNREVEGSKPSAPANVARDARGRLGEGNTLGSISHNVDETITRAKCEDLVRRVIRDGGQITHAALARETGLGRRQLADLLASPVYKETFEKVSEEVFGTIDDRIKNERLDSLTRADTIQRRALTVLGEALTLSRDHMLAVQEGRAVPKAALIKAAVDAAAEVRQVISARSQLGGGGKSLNVTINKVQANIIQGALRESGIDLSDVIDGFLVEGPTGGPS